MNSNVSQMNTLHKAYISCIDKEMTNYLSGNGQKDTIEFCAAEKNSYYTHIQSAFPEQFENILRVETNTYWNWTN